MTYPRTLPIGSPSMQKRAELETRLRRLERATGIGRQRATLRTDDSREITVTTYGLDPWLEETVDVPEDAWVVFSGEATFTFPAGAVGSREVYGSIFETTDSADPLYAGAQCFFATGGTGLSTSTRYIHPKSNTGNVTYRMDWLYAPSTGAKTYRLDFRAFKFGVPADRVLLTNCTFGIEVL